MLLKIKQHWPVLKAIHQSSAAILWLNIFSLYAGVCGLQQGLGAWSPEDARASVTRRYRWSSARKNEKSVNIQLFDVKNFVTYEVIDTGSSLCGSVLPLLPYNLKHLIGWWNASGHTALNGPEATLTLEKNMLWNGIFRSAVRCLRLSGVKLLTLDLAFRLIVVFIVWKLWESSVRCPSSADWTLIISLCYRICDELL